MDTDIIKDVVLPCVFSFVGCFAVGVQFNIRFWHLIAASVGSIVSQMIFSVMSMNDYNGIKCCFVAAAAVAFYSEVMARVCKAPVNMYLIVGIIPLVPGGLMYYTMLALVTGDNETFLDRVADAFGEAAAIAMGIFAISSLVRIASNVYKYLEKKYGSAYKGSSGIKKI